MTARVCLACGSEIPSWARADKTTCNAACRTRLSRMRTAPRNTFVTPLRAVAPRSGGVEGREPVRARIVSHGAPREAGPAPRSRTITGVASGPRPTNTVHPDRLVRVLAEGLRSIEERRAREQTEFRNRAIIGARTTEEPSDEPAQEP